MALTGETHAVTLLQTRDRIPEPPLRSDQVLVLQIPMPEPLRKVESRETETVRMHAEKDYRKMFLKLYEDVLHHGEITLASDYPVLVFNRHLMATTPIPRWDVPKLNQADNLYLFGAGREKKIYAVPPYTLVEPLSLDDYAFRVEDFAGNACLFCGSTDSYLNEIPASHGMQVIRLLCKRIIVMKHGRVIEAGLTDRVIDDPREAYTQILVHSTL